MPTTVIRAEGLGKEYRRGLAVDTGLRHALEEFVRFPMRALGRKKEETFWALKHVSLEVHEGEVLGLIGRNGAGKTTLLKILARITRPTTGWAEIHGRVGSLLEVGTGFHPELTGRENVFLNGAILGMRRREIVRKFDEIVAFAEVEKFIDTPVKHYSSGMYIRLAFAVAAHLETEILFVDEVLAVGDIAFQKKCLGKIGEVAHQGRTVVFVSHNMAPLRMLCETGLLLRNGAIAASGPIETVIGAYMESSLYLKEGHTVRLPRPPERCTVWMESVTLLGNGEPTAVLHTGDRMSLEVKFRSLEPIKKPIIGYVIRSSRGESAVNANNYYLPSAGYPSPVTEGTVVCDLGHLPLMSGSYSLSFWLCRNPHEQHAAEDVLHFRVEERDIWGNGALPPKSISCLWWPTQFRFEEPEGVSGECPAERAEP